MSEPELQQTPLMKTLLAAEFCVLFLAFPFLLLWHKPSFPPIPLLWALAVYCLIMLWRDSSFPRPTLWNPRPLRGQLISILSLFALGMVLISGLMWKFAPQLLFGFVRTHPVIWLLVMALYPVLSVYPQGFVYRSFLLHRYRNLFPDRQKKWALILLSALAFSLMHLVFRNPVAVALTFVGGILFARRQWETQSLFVSSFEHALYGCYLFTIGLGLYFYARLV